METLVPPPVTDIAQWLAGRPWLAAAAVSVLACYVAGRNLAASRRHRRLATGARLVTIAAPPQVDPTGAAELWTILVGVLTPSTWRRWLHGMPHVAFEYTWTGRQLTIGIWVPGVIPPGAVEAAVAAAWPGAACTTGAAAAPVPVNTAAATGGALVPALADALPLGIDHAADPLRPLVAAGAQIRDRDHACVQILARPASPRRARAARRAAARMRHSGGDPVARAAGSLARALVEPLLWLVEVFLPGPPRRTGTTAADSSRAAAAVRDPVRERDGRAVLDKATTAGPLWEVAIRYTVTTTNPNRPTTGRGSGGARRRLRRKELPRLRGMAHSIASAFAVHTGCNKLHRVRLADPTTTVAVRRLGRGFLLAVDELKWLAGLPTDLAIPGLQRARAKPVPAPVAVPAGGRATRVLGNAAVGGHSIALPVPDARHHIHLVGKTGTGKSTLLLNMVLADLKAGRGAVVIDPRGDLIGDILDRIPASHANRVVLIDPAQAQPASFNPLEGTDPHLVVDNLVGIFSRIFHRHWGPRIDDTLRVACLTLIRRGDRELSLVPALLTDNQFRAQYTVDLKDVDGLHGYWRWYDQMNPAMRAQVIGPVLARLRQFLLREFVKATIGTATSSFDMPQVLDGGLLLCRLPKGVLGEDTVRVLGSLLVARVWQAATARTTQPETSRRDATLYVDECHNFLNLPGSVADMLAEARGYRLSMVLAHQDLPQLPKDVAAAASANARNKIYFTVDPKDARDLAAHTAPELDEHDLAHMDRHTAAARLVIDSQETPAFTLTTRPPPAVVGQAAAIRELCSSAAGVAAPSRVEQLAREIDEQQQP